MNTIQNAISNNLVLFPEEALNSLNQKSTIDGQEYRFVNNFIPVDLPNNTYLVVNRPNGKSVHNIGFQPAKFINELPRWAILKYTKKNDIILDPFIGSGTTAVEAMLYERNCLAIEYQPLSKLISKVKATQLNFPQLGEIYSKLINNVEKEKTGNYPKPNFKALNFWFDNQVIQALSTLKHYINLLNNDDIRDFLLVCFASTVRKVSNMDDAMILAAKRKNHNNKHYTYKDVIRIFRYFYEDYKNYLKEFLMIIKDYGVSNQFIGNDARMLPKDLSVDAIITSPPYINAIDYVWASKLELHWLDLVTDDENRLELYKEEIGTEKISKDELSKQNTGTGIIEIDEIIEKIDKGIKYKASGNQNHLRAKVVEKYFLDMRTHFKEAFRVLKPGGVYCLVMGDNTICKVKIPTADLLAEIATLEGFEKIFQFQILLKNRRLNLPRNVDWATTIKHDKMVVLKKN